MAMTKTHQDRLRYWGTRLAPAAALAGALVVGFWGCGTTTTGTVAYTYDDPYLYSYYYPADVAYTSYYAADTWDYALYYSSKGPASGAGAATVIDNSGRPSLGSTLRSLIRGESVCPGQVTVTPKTAPPACSGTAVATVKNGITVVFNGCQLSGGGKLDGTFDVQATKTASTAACAANTMISLNYTGTLTNMAYTSPSGARIVIPNQSDTGTATYTFGQNATSTSFNGSGEVQFFDASGTKVADFTQSGMRTLTFSTNQTYTIDGTVSLQDQMTSGASATLVGVGVQRSNSCCRPTAGTLTISRSGGAQPGQHVWTFGATCGAAMRDGSTISLPACE